MAGPPVAPPHAAPPRTAPATARSPHRTTRHGSRRRARPGRRWLASGLLGLLVAGCGEEEPARPDLVLITVDRLAADRLDCFEGPPGEGASICALAEGGTRFAWTASPGAGEASTAATVLTGLAESVHGVGDDGRSFLADAHETLAESLARAGYATAAFVASPRLNRIRRLDQGFDHFDDRLAPERPGAAPRPGDPLRTGTESAPSVALAESAPSVALSARVRDWVAEAPTPFFVWIHASREAGPAELDRLVSRLSPLLESDADRAPAVLFVALRGEPPVDATADAPARDASRAGAAAAATTPRSRDEDLRRASDGTAIVDWRSHRVPLVWRPPGGSEAAPTARVSRRLASLVDVAPTLRAVARAPLAPDPGSAPPELPGIGGLEGTQDPTGSPESGRDLRGLEAPAPASAAPADERFVLLRAPGGERVGLASQRHLYTRRRSPLDGSGRPVPTESLRELDARYATLPPGNGSDAGNVREVVFAPGPWQRDVLDPASPVPRLEFHLARRLARALEVSHE